jgi:NOL1/NOP2/fmu family ribosome biogenesis protein
MFLEQAILQHVDNSRPLVALDLCAAPGGKTTHLSAVLNDQSLIVSNEVIQSRATILTENVQKWGPPNIVVTNNDPARFGGLSGFFDLVIVDAPCSGEGLFRKDPGAASIWSIENATLCASRQRRILTDVWPALKEDGILIYCTCTFNSNENETNMDWLAQIHDVEFKRLKLDPAWGVDELIHGHAIGYACYPHKVDGEGFFFSVLQKKESTDATKSRPATFNSPPKKVADALQGWLKQPNNALFIARGDDVQFFPEKWTATLGVLKTNLNLLTAGTSMASVKHDKLIPHHAMALSIALNQDQFTSINLDLEEALLYLRKEPLRKLPQASGFTLVRYQNLSLGWLNVMPTRANNLYPTAWRIRMAASNS